MMVLPLPAVMDGFCSLSGVEPVDSSLSSRSGGFGGLVSMDMLSAMPYGWPLETTAALRQAPRRF